MVKCKNYASINEDELRMNIKLSKSRMNVTILSLPRRALFLAFLSLLFKYVNNRKQ